MFNCKQVKDLILTDYVDHQLDGVMQSQVEAHLKQCSSCQEFACEVKANLITPLEQVSRVEVPAHVWSKIREEIQTEEYAKVSFLDRMTSWLKEVSFPRLIPAIGSFVVVMFLGMSVVLNSGVKTVQEDKASGHLTEILVLTSLSTQGEDEVETPIETYFL